MKYQWKPVYSDMVISTPRLELRPLTPEDAAEIFAAITPELTRFMAWELPVSPAAMARSQSHQISAMAAGSDLHLGIRLKDRGEFLGRAGLHAIGSAEPELGKLWPDILDGRLIRWAHRPRPQRAVDCVGSPRRLAI